MSFQSYLKKNLPPSVYSNLSHSVKHVQSSLRRNDLNRLALLFHTDKWGSHWYTQHYQRYFHPLKNQPLNILEIGVGGYSDPAEGAGSLRMWKAYFPKSQIVGIDLYDKTSLREPRIDIRQCDQTDQESLLRLVAEYGGFIIIDDGSHLSEHVITTFKILFPLLRPNGFYAIEDMQTSYWPGWGGGIGASQTSMEFFKHLADGLNHVEYPVQHYSPTYFDRNIVEIAFFHNLIILHKGTNDEKSNVPSLVERKLVANAGS